MAARDQLMLIMGTIRISNDSAQIGSIPLIVGAISSTLLRTDTLGLGGLFWSHIDNE